MSPSSRSNQEEPGRPSVLETPRSSNSATSGKTTSARSSLSDGKEKQIKRVSFCGLSPSSTSEDETSSIWKYADIVTRRGNKHVPVCRQACLAYKDVVAALNVGGRSTSRELRGKLNKNLSVELANIVQLNVTDSSNVRRNNEQECSRPQVQPAAEKDIANRVQPKRKTEVSFQDLYRHMSTSGSYQTRSTELSQQDVDIRNKPDGQLKLPRTHQNTHRLSQSPISKTGSNFPGAVKNLDEHPQKRNRSRRKTNLPALVHSDKTSHKDKFSNKVRQSFELSAFSGNETPSNHTEDFQQYIQLTRSELHPFDAERIRKDGSSVDPVISNKRSSLHTGLLVNMARRHLIESAPEMHTPAKDARSSFKVSPSHGKNKPKKQRGTKKLNTRPRQQTGNVREKRSHVEDKLNREADPRLWQTDTAILEKNRTDAISRLTAAKQLQYTNLLGNKHAHGGDTHSRIVDPPKITSIEGNLQKNIKDVKSTRIRSAAQSIVSGSCLKHSVQHKKAAPNQIVEANKQTEVDMVAEVTAKQTKQRLKSADFYPVNNLPTMASQRRNAAYLAYVKTGRRAKLLGDAIQLVQYNKDSTKTRAGGVKSGISEDTSVHKLKSGTAKNKVKVHSTKHFKPTLKEHGRLEKRCSKSGVSARNKKQDRSGPVSNVTENSSTGQKPIKTISKRKTPTNSRVTKQLTSQISKKTRKPQCRISTGPRQKCRRKTVACRETPPAAAVKSGSRVVTSHQGAHANKSKCRKKSSKVKGNRSHNAQHENIRTSKCEPINEAQRTNPHNVLSNSKCKTNNFTLKRCGLRKPPKAKKKHRKRCKPRRLQRCRCTKQKMEYFNRCNEPTDIKKKMKYFNRCNEPTDFKKKMEYFNRCNEPTDFKKKMEYFNRNEPTDFKKKMEYFSRYNETTDIEKDMCGVLVREREVKPWQNVDQTQGRNRVKLDVHRQVSPETCMNANDSMEDDSSLSDASGGLSGMSRSRMADLSRPTLSTESLYPLKSWQKLLTTEDVSSDNESNTTRNFRPSAGQRKVNMRLRREVSALIRKSTLKISDDDMKSLHRTVVQLIYSFRKASSKVTANSPLVTTPPWPDIHD